MTPLRLPSIFTLSILSLSLFIGCKSAPPEPGSKETTSESQDTSPPKNLVQKTKISAVPVSAGDPLKGKFTLNDATKDLDGSGKLIAKIDTSAGELSCELYEEKAPITVANFVGLARGIRPFKDEGKWVKRPGYDGTTFHRIIKGFMIQGGDPGGTGAGEPGYVIPDEVWAGAKHNERGQLCMANRGANTNGMQFFIMDGAAPHLDRGYTIFGKCSPEAVINKLANTPTRGDRAIEAPKINRVTVSRSRAK